MPNMMKINLLEPLSGTTITERLRRYDNSSKTKVSVSSFTEVIQWHDDPNLSPKVDDYSDAYAIVLRIPIRMSLPTYVNELLPSRFKRPRYLIARFGVWPSRDYTTIHLTTRMGDYGNEEYIHPNYTSAKRFYPLIERTIESALQL